MTTQPRVRVRFAAVFAIAAALSSQGHPATAPQLLPAGLDQGLCIELHHPRVLRASSPVAISVRVQSMTGHRDAAVHQVSYALSTDAETVSHPVHAPLPPRADIYAHYLDLVNLAEHASGVVQADALQQRTRALALLRRGSFEDRLRIDASRIPPAGDTLTIDVYIELVDGGRARTIHRNLRIPVRNPLPTGPPPPAHDRFDAAQGVMSRLPAPRANPRGGDSAMSWFAGDQHLHTRYSMDAAILDGTTENVAGYAAAAEAAGLHWIIATDHSNVDFNLLGLAWYTPAQFAAGAFEAAVYSATHDFLALNGQEMGTGAGFLLGMPSHYLAYPALTDSTGFLENPCFGYIFNVAFCEPYQVIIDRVAQAGGVGFIAHPTDTGTLYAPWNFLEGTTGWSGMEIWTSTSGRYGESDATAYDLWHSLLRQVRRPQGGRLLPRPGFPSPFPVGIGNSDAHKTSSIGAAFTYARMESVTRQNVIGALVAGRAVASNGPLLYGEINGAGIGDVATGVHRDTSLTVTLQSTPEFGPVGDYTITVHVNGVPRTVLPLPAGPIYATTVVVEGLGFALPDKFVTLRADSMDGAWKAFTNPIWLELPPCVGDVNEDQVVDIVDLILVWLAAGPCQGCPTDINRDGIVNLFDLIEVLFRLGPCSG